MNLWLTLLLVWTTGIPIGLFVIAALFARLHERRYARFMPVAARRRPFQPAIDGTCGQRLHGAPLFRSHVRVGRRRL